MLALESIAAELATAADALVPDDGPPDPAAFRAALVRAAVQLAHLARMAGAVP